MRISGALGAENRKERLQTGSGDETGSGREEVKGERWDTKKKVRTEGKREKRQREKGENQEKAMGQDDWGRGEAMEEWGLGQRGRSQIWQYRVNGCQRQSQGCQKREGRKEKSV